MIPRYLLTTWGAYTYRWMDERKFHTRRGARRAVKQYRNLSPGHHLDYTITDTWTGRHEKL